MTVAQLRTRAAEFARAGRWDDVLELSAVPLHSFAEDERSEAEVFQLRAQVQALCVKVPETTRLDNETAPGIMEALARLRAIVPRFHELPEFDIYLDTVGYSLAESLQRFELLKVACEYQVKVKWLRLLRDKVIRLTDRDGHDEDDKDDSDAARALSELPPYAEMYAVVERSLERAAADDKLTPADHLDVQVLRADVFSRSCEPWDYAEVAKRIRALPSLSPEQVALIPTEDFPVRPGQRLTPDAWAFLWELRFAWPADYPQLVEEYPSEFGVDVADGMLHLVRSAIASDPDVRDAHFVAGTELLLRAQDGDQHFLTESIVLAGPKGPHIAWVGHLGVNIEPSSELLLHMYEPLCDTFALSPQLLVLMHLMQAEEDYGDMDVEAHLEVPGLNWLAERSRLFAFMAAMHVPSRALAWVLFLDTLRWAIQQQQPMPRRYFWVSDDQQSLESEDEANAVLDAVQRLASVRSLAQTEHAKMWTGNACAIFESVLTVKKPEVQKRALELARIFEADLQEHKAHFVVGYLEQVQGEAELALERYLSYLEECENPDSVVGNLQILLNSMTRVGQVSDAIAVIDSFALETRPAVKKALLQHASARRQVLNDQDQFERTALNRWPTVTGPARSVLSALAAVDDFRDFETLGRYAGMDGTWAERHYRKLVELGMVIKTPTGYRINAHIEPLLEQENKHAVIGRIVRASGTSAVKPVFNSGREYTIYQCMVQLCPNHLVFPNCSLQSIMSFERIKPLVTEDEFSYYLKASVDIVVVSTTTYLPMLAIEVDSVWHDTERQQKNDEKKDRLFAVAGIPFLRLRPVGKPSESTIRGQVAEHLDELVRTLRSDLPGFDQARQLIEDLSSTSQHGG